MTGGLDKFNSFIKRNLVARMVVSIPISIFFTMLMGTLIDWIPGQFGFRNVIMAGLVAIVVLFVSISNLMVNWKNTIIPYCELQHQ